MWGNIVLDIVMQGNYHIGFPTTRTDSLMRITHWQYWWWFWFTYFLVLYYFLALRLFRFRTLKFRPKIVSSLRPHGKWGDLIICLLPVSWCANILSNSNLILRMLEWQSESSLFTVRIRGKQWYWVYKFELKTITDVLSAPKNIGHNKWCISTFGDLKVADSYLHVMQIRSQSQWFNQYWNTLLTRNSKPSKLLISTPQELILSDLNNFKQKNNVIQNDDLILKSPLINFIEIFKSLKEKDHNIHEFFKNPNYHNDADTIINSRVDMHNSDFNDLNRWLKKTTGVNSPVRLIKTPFKYIDFNEHNWFMSVNELLEQCIAKGDGLETTFYDEDIYTPVIGSVLTFVKENAKKKLTFRQKRLFVARSTARFWSVHRAGDCYSACPHEPNDSEYVAEKLLLTTELPESLNFIKKTKMVKNDIVRIPLKRKPLSLLTFKFNKTGNYIQHKNSSFNNYLTLKQKRYQRKKIITPKLTIYKNNKNYVTPYLYNNKLIIDNLNATQDYNFFKKNKIKSENIPITLAHRLLRTKRTLVLPAHVNIAVITNSYDVVHSWFIPGLGMKLDCIPGRATHHILHIDNVGFYYGQCAEICGRYHHHMPIRVCALPFEHFLIWWQTFGLPKMLTTNVQKNNEILYGFRKYSW